MKIDAKTVEELTGLEAEMIRVEVEIEETRKSLHRLQEHRMEVVKKFEEQLASVTDAANAVVLGSRAWWKSGGTTCNVNLNSPDA